MGELSDTEVARALGKLEGTLASLEKTHERTSTDLATRISSLETKVGQITVRQGAARLSWSAFSGLVATAAAAAEALHWATQAFAR